LVKATAEALGVSWDAAAETLSRQLSAWERAGLLGPGGAHPILPPLKAAGRPATEEPSQADIRAARLSPVVAVHLASAEHHYRRSLRRSGLADALNRLPPAKGALRPGAVWRILRAYFALRRVTRQGDDARDCLLRSLALTHVLRRNGIDADLCIGIYDLPFLSHAWVEQHGHVLNDRASTVARYGVIGRF
jgi:hypothetical protein